MTAFGRVIFPFFSNLASYVILSTYFLVYLERFSFGKAVCKPKVVVSQFLKGSQLLSCHVSAMMEGSISQVANLLKLIINFLLIQKRILELPPVSVY